MRTRSRVLYSCVVVALAVGLAVAPGCRKRANVDDTETPNVVTTIGMLADAARALAGDCVKVTALMGPGVDPHLYRARAGDLDHLAEADLILFGGLGLEGKMGDVLDRVSQRTPTVAVLEAVPADRRIDVVGGAGHADPHMWMDVAIWRQAISALREPLSEVVPACAEAIEASAQAYDVQLEALDQWVAASVSTVPRGQRALVTAHDAFAYFGAAYEVDVVGIQGVSTESEASVADIQETVEFMVNRRIPALFIESSINPRNVEAVRAASAARGWTLAEGGQLFSDAMGDDGTWQGTYIGMIRSNVLTIVTALGGEAAPWPEPLAPWAQRWELE